MSALLAHAQAARILGLAQIAQSDALRLAAGVQKSHPPEMLEHVALILFGMGNANIQAAQAMEAAIKLEAEKNRGAPSS